MKNLSERDIYLKQYFPYRFEFPKYHLKLIYSSYVKSNCKILLCHSDHMDTAMVIILIFADNVLRQYVKAFAKISLS